MIFNLLFHRYELGGRLLVYLATLVMGVLLSASPCAAQITDCNGNKVPDEIDIAKGDSLDCNENGIPDECDLDEGTSLDCNTNDIPDECDISSGASDDCNFNGIPDECDAPLADCNANGIPDGCELNCDHNSNTILDRCEVADEACRSDFDCNDVVDIDDYLETIGEWGPCIDECFYDIAPPTKDGFVNSEDAFLVRTDFGPCDAGAATPITGHCQTTRLIPNDLVDGDWFGRSVALDGDVALASSHYGGATYVFERAAVPSNSWNQVKKLSGTSSIAVDGDLALVSSGVYRRDSGGPSSWGLVETITGALDVDSERIAAVTGSTVSIYEPDAKIADQWNEVAQISSPAGAQAFGSSASLSGDRIAVGAPMTIRQSDTQQTGAVYIFERDEGGANNWGQVQKLFPSDDLNAGRFGESVSLSETTLLIGTRNQPMSSFVDKAYIFQRNSKTETWAEAKILASSFDPAIDIEGMGDAIGSSLSLAGDYAVVGAMFDDDAGRNAGTTTLFHRNQGGASNWGELTKLVPTNGTHRDLFGASVATDGNFVIVGAFRHDTDGDDTGTAYIHSIIVGDLTGDGRVNVDDLLQQIGQWGDCPAEPACCSGDVDYNRKINVDDLLILIGNWGDHG